jgi:RND family efflux transporter MFP subunit
MTRAGTIGLVLAAAGAAAAAEVDGLSLPWKAVRVSSPVQEIVAEVKVEEGVAVKKGQVLARLHDEKEQAEHDRARKIVEKREFDARAATALVADKITSKEKALEAEIELQLARVDVDVARRKLEEKTIRSPLDGVVVRKLKEEGESADRVEPIFEIVNIDRLFLQFYVDRKLASGLARDQDIEFWVAGEPAARHRARVDFISPGADAASGLFRVKLVFDNPGHALKAGVRVTADFPPPR